MNADQESDSRGCFGEVFKHVHRKTKGHLKLVARGTAATVGEKIVSILSAEIVISKVAVQSNGFGAHIPSLGHLEACM